MLFYHYALAKFSKKTAAGLGLSFIAGAETAILSLFLVIYYIILLLLFPISEFGSSLLSWILSGVLFALSIFCFFFYFRKGSSMSTFLPRKFVHSIDNCAKNTKSFPDAFLLGLVSTLPELFLTLPLYIIFSIEIMRFDNTIFPRPLLVFLSLFIIMTQHFLVQLFFRSGHNLAEIDRIRRKNKQFTRLMLSFLYLVLAILIITLEF